MGWWTATHYPSQYPLFNCPPHFVSSQNPGKPTVVGKGASYFQQVAYNKNHACHALHVIKRLHQHPLSIPIMIHLLTGFVCPPRWWERSLRSISLYWRLVGYEYGNEEWPSMWPYIDIYLKYIYIYIIGFNWFIFRCSMYIYYSNISLISLMSIGIAFFDLYTFELCSWHMLNTCNLEKKATQGTLPRTTGQRWSLHVAGLENHMGRAVDGG